MRLKLFLSVLFFCAITKAQTNTELKDFINKNSGAIRSVQKNMLRENNNSYAVTFKEIVKNHEASVKLYNSDKKASYYFASLVRMESLSFLKGHSQGGSTEYFEITETEKAFSKSETVDLKKILSSDEIKSIDDIDAMNPQSTNKHILTIQ